FRDAGPAVRTRLGADLGHFPAIVGCAGKTHNIVLARLLRLLTAGEGVLRRSFVAGPLTEDGTQPPDDEHGQGEKDDRRNVEGVLHGLSVVSSPGGSPVVCPSVQRRRGNDNHLRIWGRALVTSTPRADKSAVARACRLVCQMLPW